jgi:hypothetical protein
VLEKTLANPYQPASRNKQLLTTDHLISMTRGRGNLAKFFENPSFNEPDLRGVTLEQLLTDLDKIADTQGFIATFKRLKQEGVQVKGTVAEIQQAARERTAGGLEQINMPLESPLNGKQVTLADGTRVTIKNTSDVDVVTRTHLVQVKIGAGSVELHEVEVWLLQAAELNRSSGGTRRIGFRVDHGAATEMGLDATGRFPDGSTSNYKRIFDKLKKDYGDIFDIEVISFR